MAHSSLSKGIILQGTARARIGQHPKRGQRHGLSSQSGYADISPVTLSDLGRVSQSSHILLNRIGIGVSASHLIYYMSQQLEHTREGPRTQIAQAS